MAVEQPGPLFAFFVYTPHLRTCYTRTLTTLWVLFGAAVDYGGMPNAVQALLPPPPPSCF